MVRTDVNATQFNEVAEFQKPVETMVSKQVNNKSKMPAYLEKKFQNAVLKGKGRNSMESSFQPC